MAAGPTTKWIRSRCCAECAGPTTRTASTCLWCRNLVPDLPDSETLRKMYMKLGRIFVPPATLGVISIIATSGCCHYPPETTRCSADRAAIISLVSLAQNRLYLGMPLREVQELMTAMEVARPLNIHPEFPRIRRWSLGAEMPPNEFQVQTQLQWVLSMNFDTSERLVSFSIHRPLNLKWPRESSSPNE